MTCRDARVFGLAPNLKLGVRGEQNLVYAGKMLMVCSQVGVTRDAAPLSYCKGRYKCRVTGIYPTLLRVSSKVFFAASRNNFVSLTGVIK
jgi:hypothetical protein